MLTILPDLEALIPSHSEEEYRQLESNLLKDGVRDAFIVWPHEGQTILLDGHTRNRIGCGSFRALCLCHFTSWR